MRDHPLDEICAIQWQRCVEASWRGLHGLPARQLVTVRYEDLVSDPVTQTGRLAESLGLNDGPEVRGISPESVGKGRDALGAESVARLESLVGSTLERVHHG
jgi:hypothetical protein